MYHHQLAEHLYFQWFRGGNSLQASIDIVRSVCFLSISLLFCKLSCKVSDLPVLPVTQQNNASKQTIVLDFIPDNV